MGIEEWMAGGMNDPVANINIHPCCRKNSPVKDKYVVTGCHKLLRTAEGSLFSGNNCTQTKNLNISIIFVAYSKYEEEEK